jgi:ubiquinone/menaquinone biosynthesis C-methylase UbiE
MSPDRTIVGSDVSQRRIRIAQGTVSNNERMSFLVKKADEFDFSGFSTVTVVDLLHHMSFKQHEKLLKKIYRELQAPGVLVLKDLEREPKWKYAYHYLQDSLFYRSKLAIRSSEDMRNLLDKIGFRTDVISLRSWLPYPHIVYVCEK